jgi:hypothetical protein
VAQTIDQMMDEVALQAMMERMPVNPQAFSGTQTAGQMGALSAPTPPQMQQPQMDMTEQGMTDYLTRKVAEIKQRMAGGDQQTVLREYMTAMKPQSQTAPMMPQGNVQPRRY